MSLSACDSESSYNSDGSELNVYSDYEGEIEPSSEDEVSNRSTTNSGPDWSDQEE